MTELLDWAPTRQQAETAIESLRKGIPPLGRVRHFTVGRDTELAELANSLATPSDGMGGALLLRANYGGGKTHLLNVIREMALESDYAVSLVTMDAAGGVRANRMDQVFGAVSSALEVPGSSGGLASLLDRAVANGPNGPDRDVWAKISDNERWTMSDYLKSSAIFVALRAWATSAGDSSTRALVVDWLSNPHAYKNDRKRLYNDLVNRPDHAFYDPRPEWQFYKDGCFVFTDRGYEQSWDALDDLHQIAKVAGLRGLILLIDEFEDVVQNLNNRDYQQSAFLNLFRFFDGFKFPGMAYFAVTPDFVAKCKNELMNRQVYGFPVSRFDSLSHFEMSRIRPDDLSYLAQKIRSLHSTAYAWDARKVLDDAKVHELVGSLTSRSSQDQTRQAIIGIVEHLDALLGEIE